MEWGEMTSRFYRVRILATEEEQIFSSPKEALTWIAKVRHTFCNPEMTCIVTQVTERSRTFPPLGEKGTP